MALSVTYRFTAYVPRSYLAAYPWSPDFPRYSVVKRSIATIQPLACLGNVVRYEPQNEASRDQSDHGMAAPTP